MVEKEIVMHPPVKIFHEGVVHNNFEHFQAPTSNCHFNFQKLEGAFFMLGVSTLKLGGSHLLKKYVSAAHTNTPFNVLHQTKFKQRSAIIEGMLLKCILWLLVEH